MASDLRYRVEEAIRRRKLRLPWTPWWTPCTPIHDWSCALVRRREEARRGG